MTDTKPNPAWVRSKQPIRANVTPTAKRLLHECAEARGVTMTAILEQLIRDYARELGITDKETNS